MAKENFVISIEQIQNGGWKGTIYWAEAKKTMCFRSSLEMLILIESAISSSK